MSPFEKTVHYIWVGDAVIPEEYLANMEAAKLLNPNYEFKFWRDEDFIQKFPDFSDRYKTATIFHKLQLARYFFVDTYGGIYTDFDIKWKVGFDVVFNRFDSCQMVFNCRDDIVKYSTDGTETPHIDDFVFASKPGKVKSFIEFADKHIDRTTTNKFLNIEILSFLLLTTWAGWQEGVSHLTTSEVSKKEESIFGIHNNHLTWQKNQNW